jgi:hypothetical protein
LKNSLPKPTAANPFDEGVCFLLKPLKEITNKKLQMKNDKVDDTINLKFLTFFDQGSIQF